MTCGLTLIEAIEHTPRQLELMASERKKVEAGRLSAMASVISAAAHAAFMGRDGSGPLKQLTKELNEVANGNR